MSDEWNKDGNGFDSVPLNDHTESEAPISGDNRNMQAQDHSADTGTAEQSNTTYSWVNPKLQQQSGTEDKREWDSAIRGVTRVRDRREVHGVISRVQERNVRHSMTPITFRICRQSLRRK